MHLLDAGGALPRHRDDLRAPDPAEVTAEVRAQFDRFRQLTGRLPTHLDGHHHCHRVPAVGKAVVAVATELGLPVRDAGQGVRERLEAASVVTTDRFDNSFYAEGASLKWLLDFLAGLGSGSTELMCHPGVVDDELAAGSTYTHDREREIEILTHPEVVRAARRPGVGLAHWGALGATS